MKANIYVSRPWLKFYNPGVPADVELNDELSVGELFDEATKRWRKNTSFIFYGTKITFGDLRDKVDRLAAALTAMGLKKGDCIAMLLLNSPEFVICMMAAFKVGLIQTHISPVYVSDEIKHQILDSGAKSIICQDILYEGIEKTGIKFENIILTNISESLPRLKKLIGTTVLRGVYQKMAAPSPNIYLDKHVHKLQDIINNAEPKPPNTKIKPKEDVAFLPYTGGTTGAPKGVMLTHYNIVSNYYQNKAALQELELGKETFIGFMPFYHAAGLSALLLSLFGGFTCVIVTNPDIDDIIQYLVQYKVSYFLGAPTMYEILKDHEKTDRVNWGKMKLIESGADSLHENTAKEWQERTGTKITEAYGLTEVVAVAHINPKGKEKYGSIGVPAPSTYAAIIDPDEDTFLDVDEIGELVLSGPQVTLGYWKNEEATKECEAIIGDRRWWRTGDLGQMDQDGYFFIYDRKRDLIKYKGLRIFAREVEEVLKRHPSIKDAGVIGVRDPAVGQNVKAVIVLESDARGRITEREIQEYCKDKLAHYKIPKIIDFVGEIPKTDIGKVSRREIRTEEE
ncbi:MAG: AMP-binding protein [Smithellaceae bacterium]|nr:AMP-binding protein [Smithellaceae bacterium]